MKFGRQLLQEAYPQYRHFYLAYKDLKQAIKLITGSGDAYSIQEVTSNFGNNTAFAGSVFRPPESRFQDLLNTEKEKINKFMEVALSAVLTALRQVLKDLHRKESDERYVSNLEEAEALIDEQADQLIFLESYQRINAIGFRKITKKYDKHNESHSSPWYMSQLAKEPFMTADFETPLVYLSACYDEIRRRRDAVHPDKPHSATLDLVQEEEEDREDSSNPISEEVLVSPRPPIEATASSPSPRMPTPDAIEEVESSIESHKQHGSPDEKREPVMAVKDVLNQRTAKYLVRPEDIMKLKCLLLKYIPIAFLGNSGRISTNLEELLNPINQIQPVKREVTKKKYLQCCLYFDTPKFDAYRQMTAAAKSSKVSFRLRWVGENNGEPEKDIIIEKVNLEEPASSIHEWPDEMPDNVRGNVPDAVVLKQKHVQALLNGTFNISEWLHRKNYTVSRAQQMRVLLEAAAQEFATRVPIVQVWYNRTSFRLDDGRERLCFHLDDQIQFVSELSKDTESGATIMKRDRSYDSLVTPYLAARSADTVDTLAFGVLSVAMPREGAFPYSLAAPRLCAEDCESHPDHDNRPFLASRQTPEPVDFPMFIQMITGLTSVTEVWTFTFYLHGFANISRKLALGLPVPHWYKFLPTNDDEEEVEEKNKRRHGHEHSHRGSMSSELNATVALKESYNSTGRVDVLRDSPGDRLIRDQEEDLKVATAGDTSLETAGATAIDILTDLPNSSGGGTAGPSLLPPPRYLDGGKSLKAQGFLEIPASIPVDMDTPKATGTTLDDLSRPLLPPSTHVSNIPTASGRQIEQSGPALMARIRSRCAQLRSLCGGDKKATSTEAAKIVNTAVRVEPKTFFANERTLLQWMNMAVLLATISITLLNFGTLSSRIGGLIMAPVAIYFIVHAYVIYARRGRALERKEPIDYSDRTGPFVLVVSLVTALSLIVGLNVMEHPIA